MNIKKLIFCAFIVTTFSYAQTDSLDSTLQDSSSVITSGLFKKNNDLIRVADAFAYTMTAPIRWEESDWLTAGGVLGETMILSLGLMILKDFLRLTERN